MFHPDTGVLSVSCERWKGAQQVEKWFRDRHTKSSDRNSGHEMSFDKYKSLPSDLGYLVELGAGPYTQTQTILKGRTAKSVTLIEPMLVHYMKDVKNCFYRNGTFKDIPTTFISIPAEEFRTTRKFDTLVMINVIEHVYDALSILNLAVSLIKENGLLIWHERVWDIYNGRVRGMGYEKDFDFRLHPIRIKRPIAKQVIFAFNPLFESWNAPQLRRIGHKGVYFIGRKKSEISLSLERATQPCVKLSSGDTNVVFFVSNNNYTFIYNSLEKAENVSSVKYILLLLTEGLSDEANQSFLLFEKIKVILSQQHVSDYNVELSYYVSKCQFTVQHLDDDMLHQPGTICIGSNEQL